ncbi:hypothetical protein TIFTF001_035768 [Ficus carica]|uniref:Uncharacterized protein n=1 Tax=Ficus carica TaxID=3494 RepID=A0AA88EBE6_FICCA|nr:hypothetical protein TIFTF001_041465 [Ficus carica]GMN66704.1 hypothetical protein TIFTF001_035768 [Ficus carica]
MGDPPPVTRSPPHQGGPRVEGLEESERLLAQIFLGRTLCSTICTVPEWQGRWVDDIGGVVHEAPVRRENPLPATGFAQKGRTETSPLPWEDPPPLPLLLSVLGEMGAAKGGETPYSTGLGFVETTT